LFLGRVLMLVGYGTPVRQLRHHECSALHPNPWPYTGAMARAGVVIGNRATSHCQHWPPSITRE